MCGGNKTQQTSTSTAPPSWLTSSLKNVVGQAQNVASTPWNPATGQQVAGFTNPQNQAFGLTQSNLGAYQPNLTAAGNNAAYGSAPITASAIQNYMDPYTQNVVDATAAQFAHQNALQLQDVNANAAKIGALTGDRSQVARSITQNQQNLAQNPIIAGLYSQGYTQALGAAQNDAGRALQGAQIQGGLAGLAQQYGQNDVNSLWGIGQAQQTQQQNVLNANTENAQAQAQYPFATTQWLSSILSNAGSLAGSQSTTTTPGPNMWSQLLGLGVGALGAFNAGGRVGYDAGGTVLPYGDAHSYVPTASMSRGALMGGPREPIPTSNNDSFSTTLANFKQARDGMAGLGRMGSKAWGYANTTTDPNSTTTSVNGQTYTVPGFSTLATPSGASGWGNWLGNSFGYADGGFVRRGYEGGGEVTDLVDDGTGLYAEPGLFNLGQGLNKNFADNGPADVPSPWQTTVVAEPTRSKESYVPESTGLGATPTIPAPDNFATASIPAQLSPSLPTNENTPAPAASASPESVPSWKMPESEGLLGLKMPDPVRQGLMSAGLAMMASKSPFIGTAIGEGGIAGLRSYGDIRQQAIENAQSKRKVDLEAQRLAQQAREATERLKYEGQRTAYEGQRTASDVSLQNVQRAGLLKTQSQKKALLDAMQSDPTFLDRFKGTPFEAVARAAAAGGDLDALAGLVEKMQPKVSGTTFINPSTNVATDTLSGTSYDMRTGQILPPKVEGSTDASGQRIVVDPTQYGLPAGTQTTEYFTTLPDPYRRKLVNIYTGQDSLAGASRGNAATLMRMQMDVQRAFPDYQPVDAQNRSTIMHSLADTKSSTSLYNQRKTLGTFAEHLAAPDGALRAAKDLPNGSVLAWNAARNEFNNQTGDPRLTALNTRLHFLQGELGKMVTNNVLTDREAIALEKQVSSASSPAQLRAAFDAYYALIKGRVESVDNATASAMGNVYDPTKHSVATKQTRELFEKYERDPWGKQIPANAIRHLRAEPSAANRKDFDDLFGSGASERVLGGN